MDKNECYRTLMDEVVRSKPDLLKVRKAARALGFEAKGDLVEIMAEVLGAMNRKKPARKRPTEVEL
ncbi:MAG: hypothetical protein KF789_11465 [Bdellovibrionaceae bacterium]|nr:hypothetical protein [Pseudobdellovibrionaceae bacterium]MBX3041314.1 hypothetical protein [Pseudobdellovibrionaceae bacterium]